MNHIYFTSETAEDFSFSFSTFSKSSNNCSINFDICNSLKFLIFDKVSIGWILTEEINVKTPYKSSLTKTYKGEKLYRFKETLKKWKSRTDLNILFGKNLTDGYVRRYKKNIEEKTQRGIRYYRWISFKEDNLREQIQFGLFKVFGGDQNNQGILYLNRNQFVEEPFIRAVAGELGLNPDDRQFKKIYFEEAKKYREALLNFARRHYDGGFSLPKNKVDIGELLRKDKIKELSKYDRTIPVRLKPKSEFFKHFQLSS